jgi:Acetyltransferase (GNAT) family
VITYEWRGPFTSTEVSALHEEAFGGQCDSGGVGDRGAGTRDWRAQVERHSLGWVCARDGADLAGFVNVAWDGGVHAFILDTLVAAGMRRLGIGTGLMTVAVGERAGRAASGCTSTSRSTCGRSTSVIADSPHPAAASSPCESPRRVRGQAVPGGRSDGQEMI